MADRSSLSPKPASVNRDTTQRRERTVSTAQTTTAGNLWLRIYWMALGNLLLVAAAMGLMANPGSIVAVAGFWIAALALGAARFFDVTRYDGETADGEPATRTDLRRYLLGLGVCSGALFGVVLLVGQVW